MKVTSENYDGKLYIKLGRKYIPLEQDIVYFEKLEQENEQLKNTIMQLRKQVDKMKNCSNCNGIIKGGMRSERCEFCIKDKDFRYWEPAE